MSIIISVGPWATSPHARKHAEPKMGRAEFGFGWHAPTTCGHQCSSIQEVLEPETFFDFSILIFI